MLSVLALDLLLLAGVAALGYAVCRVLLTQEPLLQAAVSFPLGAGLLTWLVFLLGWLGFPVTALSYLAAAGFVGLLVLTLQRLRRTELISRSRPIRPWRPGRPELVIVLGLSLLAFAALGWLAVARSYSTWDAMAIWSVKGYGIAHESSIFAAAEWGTHGLSYPLQLPLLIGAFRLLDGDLLPVSKLVFPFYYLSLLLGVYGFQRRRGAVWSLAAVSALVVGTVPLVLEHSTIGYANLPLTTLLMLGTLTFFWGWDDGPAGYLLLSGILYGLAAWMRPEALYLVLAGMVALALVAKFGHERNLTWPAWVTPVVLIAGSWLIFNLSHGVTSVFGDSARTAAVSLLVLDFNPGGAYQVLRFLVGQYASPEVWGFAAPLTVLLALLSWHRLAPSRDPHAFSLLAASLAWGLPVLFFYYLLSFRGDLAYWLGTGIDRLMMPATVAALLWGLSVALPADRIQVPLTGDNVDRPD